MLAGYLVSGTARPAQGSSAAGLWGGLCWGSVSGPWAVSVQRDLKNLAKQHPKYLAWDIAGILIFWVPAIAGMVIVGQEIKGYGICARFDAD